jgi:hypothetical protein
MKNIIYKLYISFIASLLIISCKPKFYEAPAPAAPSAGTVTFNSYIAIGGAIEAGYADNTLYHEAQAYAYPNLIALQFVTVNSSLAFGQPTIISNIGYVSATPTNLKYLGKRTLQYPSGGCNTSGVVPTADSMGLSHPEIFDGEKSKITNLGVPFISVKQTSKAFSTFAASSSATNPRNYLRNIIDTVNAPNESISLLAASKGASFFTLWLGYDEFLGIAKSGVVSTAPGIGVDTTGLHALIASLLSVSESKGAIATIPYVDLFPIVTNSNRRLTSATDPGSYPGSRTVKGKAVKRLPTVSLVGFNLALGSDIFSTDSTKSQNYVITKGDGTLAIINPSQDYVVNSGIIDLQLGVGPKDSLRTRSCSSETTKRQGIGLSKAIPNNAVLDADEILELRLFIDSYNDMLRSIVNQYHDRLVLVDLNIFFTKLTDPLYGIPFGTEIVRTNHPALGPDFGGFFSTDRTYPTPKGQALIANEFIKAINGKWGAKVPTLNIDNYRANVIPD